ncbi:MAG: multidrug effflux MFS transporter [Candidatus Berkiella sp.]
MKSYFQLPLVALIIVSLLGCCMEIDISLPSFPSIMSHFGATEAQVQSTLSVNFLAFCLSGLLYGPLSESWGRKRLMLFGATCFMVGAIGCVFSQSIYQLMFWRFVQGLGASSTLVLGFTMISDKFSGDTAASYIAKINAYITIFMAAAPILGSLIINYFSWRANFTFVAMIAFIAWILLVLQLPETKTQTTSLKMKTILSNYWEVLTNATFLSYATLPNMLVTAYLTFVGSASFYYINTCALSYFEFALHQGLIVSSFSLMSFYSGKVVAKIGPETAVRFAMWCCGLSIIMMSFFAMSFPNFPWGITTSMCLLAIGCAFPMSVTFAKSMEIIPSQKGACSSFIMSSRLLISACGVALTGAFFDGSMRPVVLVMAICVAIAIGLYINMNRLAASDAATS